MSTGIPRANRDGDPCPPWCVTDHDELLIPGKPRLGYVRGHVSDPVTAALWPAEVRVRRSGLAGEAATVDVTRFGMPVLSLAPGKAAALAALLEGLPGSMGTAGLIDQLRAAAGIARGDAGPRDGAR